MTLPIYAATAGAILIILQALLMMTVGLYRAKSGINLGVAGDKELERRIRRHGNLAENAGLFVAVLAVAEMTVVPSNIIKYIAIAFVIARLSHAAALSTEVGSHGGKGSKLFRRRARCWRIRHAGILPFARRLRSLWIDAATDVTPPSFPTYPEPNTGKGTIMTIALSQLFKSSTAQSFRALVNMLEKAKAHAAEAGAEDAAYLENRLYPDMHPMKWQVQMIAEFAVRGAARLQGVAADDLPDTPYDADSFDALIARVKAMRRNRERSRRCSARQGP